MEDRRGQPCAPAVPTGRVVPVKTRPQPLAHRGKTRKAIRDVGPIREGLARASAYELLWEGWGREGLFVTASVVKSAAMGGDALARRRCRPPVWERDSQPA